MGLAEREEGGTGIKEPAFLFFPSYHNLYGIMHHKAAAKSLMLQTFAETSVCWAWALRRNQQE